MEQIKTHGIKNIESGSLEVLELTAHLYSLQFISNNGQATNLAYFDTLEDCRKQFNEITTNENEMNL